MLSVKEKEMWKKLKQFRPYLTKQQYLTIKGQLKKGELDGAWKGMNQCYYKNKQQRTKAMAH